MQGRKKKATLGLIGASVAKVVPIQDARGIEILCFNIAPASHQVTNRPFQIIHWNHIPVIVLYNNLSDIK